MRYLFACLLLSLCAAPLLADIGPKPRTTGPGIVPQTDMKNVNIEMTSEEVKLVLSKGDNGDTLDVTVTFHMTNLGDAQAFEIGFPMGAFKNMTDFSVTTDGVTREARIIDKRPEPAEEKAKREKSQYREQWNHDYWWVWDESWAAGAKVTHVVKYKLSVWHFSEYRHTGYVLHTGAAWKNKIKEAKVTLKLEGGLEMGNVTRLGPAGAVIDGNTASWDFKDLEPGSQDDIQISYNRNETIAQEDARLVKESSKWWSSRLELVRLRKSAPLRFGAKTYTKEQSMALRDALANLISEAKADGDKLVMPAEEPEKITWGEGIPEEVRKAMEKEMGNTSRGYARKDGAHTLLDSFSDVVEVANALKGDAAAQEMLKAWDNLVAKCLDGKLYAGDAAIKVDAKREGKLKKLREAAAELLKPQVEQQG